MGVGMRAGVQSVIVREYYQKKNLVFIKWKLVTECLCILANNHLELISVAVSLNVAQYNAM